MAELTQHPSADSKKVRAKKKSTRIDMTPMVDLAFLLLTFFILTATFNMAHVMQVVMPDKPENPSELPMIPASKILNIVLAEGGEVYWWTGLDEPLGKTTYARSGIRKLLLDKKNEVPDMMVLLKPMDDAQYENLVDALDELEITAITRYAIVDLTDDETARIAGFSLNRP